jgi:hypothetical protein
VTRMTPPSRSQRHGPAEPAPFRGPSAVSVEKLHAIVLPTADDQPVLAIDDKGMRRHELARTLANLAEARAPLVFRTKTMDPRISTAVSDVDLSFRRDGGACWMVEGGHPSRAGRRLGASFERPERVRKPRDRPVGERGFQHRGRQIAREGIVWILSGNRVDDKPDRRKCGA